MGDQLAVLLLDGDVGVALAHQADGGVEVVGALDVEGVLEGLAGGRRQVVEQRDVADLHQVDPRL